jgi:hypothetical protein
MVIGRYIHRRRWRRRVLSECFRFCSSNVAKAGFRTLLGVGGFFSFFAVFDDVALGKENTL